MGPNKGQKEKNDNGQGPEKIENGRGPEINQEPQMNNGSYGEQSFSSDYCSDGADELVPARRGYGHGNAQRGYVVGVPSP